VSSKLCFWFQTIIVFSIKSSDNIKETIKKEKKKYAVLSHRKCICVPQWYNYKRLKNSLRDLVDVMIRYAVYSINAAMATIIVSPQPNPACHQ